MNDQREMIDLSKLREYLASKGLNMQDMAIVCKNKRIKKLLEEPFKESKLVLQLKKQIKDLEALIEQQSNKVPTYIGNPRRTPEAKPESVEDIFAEIYPDGEFRRYIVGRRMLRKYFSIGLNGANFLVEKKQTLINGNTLVKGIQVPRICNTCNEQGIIGQDFRIRKEHVAAKCIPCDDQYFKEYRERNRNKLKQQMKTWRENQ